MTTEGRSKRRRIDNDTIGFLRERTQTDRKLREKEKGLITSAADR